MPPTGQSHSRIPAIDALRALAVLPVILFHLRPAWLPGGFLGVDVFFVISGFLITGIILRELSAGEFSFRNFYARRIRRILPALFLMLAVVSVLWFWRHPLDFGDVSQLTRGVVLLKANLQIEGMVGDYWGAAAQAQPLLHTWSLAVEEQYYLVFPLFLWAVFRLSAGRCSAWPLALVGFGSLAAFLYMGVHAAETAFYSTFTRGWELLAGSVAAVSQWRRREVGPDAARADDRSGVVGLILVAAAYLLPAWVGGARQWGPLLAVAGAVLFLGGLRGHVAGYAWLCRPPLLFIGTISYSLYLWHWPVVVFFGLTYMAAADSPASIAWQAGLIFAAGFLSHRYVEESTRRWRFTTWAMLLAAVALFAGVRQAGKWQEATARRLYGELGLRSSVDPRSPVADPLVGGFAGMTMRGGLHVDGGLAAIGEKYAAIKIVEPSAAEGRRLVGGEPGSADEVLVWGDSHAMVLAPTIDALARRANIRATFHIKDGVDPLVRGGGKDAARQAKGLELLARQPRLCLFAMRYDGRRFEDYEASLAEILRHTRLVVVQQPPVLAIPDICTVNYFAHLRDQQGVPLAERRVADRGRAARRLFEDKLLAKFGDHPGFTFLRTEARLTTPQGDVRWWDGVSRLHYIDDDHLSEFGCELLAPLLEQALKR